MADLYWVGSSGATWLSAANWSATSGGAGGAGIPTSTDNVIFDRATTYTVDASIGQTLTCANFTVSAGTVTFSISTAALYIYGNYSVVAATIWSNSAGSVRFTGSGTQNITTNGTNIQQYVVFEGTGTYQLQDNFTANATNARAVTFTSGALDLNNKQFICQGFLASNTNVRSIAFGTTGKFTLVGSRTTSAYTAWTTADTTNLTITGTPVLDLTGTNGVSSNHLFAAGYTDEASAISVNIKSTVLGSVFLGQGPGVAYNNVDFTGFTGTFGNHIYSPFTVYGNWTFSTGMIVDNSTSNLAITFAKSTGTQTITSSGKSFNCPLIFGAAGGTVFLADAISVSATSTSRALTLVGGTFDGNSKTITNASAGVFGSTGTVTIKNVTTALAFTLTSGTLTQGAANTFGATTFNNGTFDGNGYTTTATGGGFTMATGSVIVKNLNTARAFTHTSGTLTFGANNTTAAYTFNAGTLNLAGYQLNASTFTSNGTGIRTLAFGTGNITCTGLGGTLFDSTTTTNLSVTGTPVVNIPYSGATATTVAAFATTEAQSISFNIQAGTYALTMMGSSRSYRSVNFTGFSGTLGALGSNTTIYGSLTLSSTMTLSGGSLLLFAGTNVGNTITTSGKIINFPVQLNGIGASWILQDAFTISGALCNIRHYNGTLDLNGKTLTLAAVTNSYYTDPGTKNITFNGGTIIATNDFVNQTPTGFTTTAGTGVGKISVQKATGFTFTGGGSTYNCTISNDGAGALSITGNNTIQTLTTTVGNVAVTGSNTITTIANAVQPVTFTFTAGTTQTINNWSVSGTAGNLVTLTSSSAGTAASLSDSSGVISANYLSIKDIAATGGATWYAGANSTNVSGNSGWIFSAAPIVSTVTFAITEPQDTSAIGITAQTSAALAATDPPDTASIAVDVSDGPITLSLDATEAQDVAEIAATVTLAPAVLSLGVTEAQDVAAISATATFASVVLSLDATETPDTAACVVGISATAFLAASEAKDVVAVSAAVTSDASLAANETPDTASVTVEYFNQLVLGATEAQDTAAGVASAYTTAFLAATEAKDVVAVYAAITGDLSLAASEASDTASVAMKAFKDSAATTASVSASSATCLIKLVASGSTFVVSTASVSAGMTRTSGAVTVAVSAASATGYLLWVPEPSPTGTWAAEAPPTVTWGVIPVPPQTWTDL